MKRAERMILSRSHHFSWLFSLLPPGAVRERFLGRSSLWGAWALPLWCVEEFCTEAHGRSALRRAAAAATAPALLHSLSKAQICAPSHAEFAQSAFPPLHLSSVLLREAVVAQVKGLRLTWKTRITDFMKRSNPNLQTLKCTNPH